MNNPNKDLVFDYRALRLLVGIIALSLPFVVTYIAMQDLTSISASYFTTARDAFVGMLFIVGAFLWAYNGHTTKQSYLSKVAGVSALGVAIFPTTCDLCETAASSGIHVGSAAILFSILAYFCFVPFRENVKGKKKKRGRRNLIYILSGSTMIACILIIGLANTLLPKEVVMDNRITYWAEAVALGAFGLAWIVAGKYFSAVVDDDEEMLELL